MERSLFLIALLFMAASLATGQEISKQEPSPPPSTPAAAAVASSGASPGMRIPERIRQRMEKLPEEERAKFFENYRQWQQMSDDEKMHLRERAVREKQKIHNAVEEALKKTGLVLTPEKREIFALRYMQERKKIEYALRAELQEKRNKLIDEALEKLKAEFEADSKPKESAVRKPVEPVASPTP